MDNYRQGEGFARQGLYDPENEHDNCGIGAVVNISGKQETKVVDEALRIVETLEHRAGKDAEGKTGDGVGVLLQISHSFFRKAAGKCGIRLAAKGSYGIAMFFMPQSRELCDEAKEIWEQVLSEEKLELLGWREVPVDSSVLGTKALSTMPTILQCFVGKPENVAAGIDFDRMLYVARMVFEKREHNTYVCSCSSRTIVYK